MTTVEENLLWEYIDEESDVMLLKIKETVENDGYSKAAGDDVEVVASLLLSATVLKMVAVMCERDGGKKSLHDLYMDVVKGQVELLKMYVVQQFRQGA